MIIITAELIQNTNTYIMLGNANPKHPGLNNKIHQQMLIKRKSREDITHQMILWRNGKEIEPVLSKYQQEILMELIEAEKADLLKYTE